MREEEDFQPRRCTNMRYGGTEPTRFADNIEAIKPLTRGRYRWNRFWKRVRHPFKKNLFWKITYIIEDGEKRRRE